jgi:hypothetical protein
VGDEPSSVIEHNTTNIFLLIFRFMVTLEVNAMEACAYAPGVVSEFLQLPTVYTCVQFLSNV